MKRLWVVMIVLAGCTPTEAPVEAVVGGDESVAITNGSTQVIA